MNKLSIHSIPVICPLFFTGSAFWQFVTILPIVNILCLVEENAKVLEERGGAVRLGGHLQKLVNSRVLGLTVVMRLVENDEMML